MTARKKTKASDVKPLPTPDDEHREYRVRVTADCRIRYNQILTLTRRSTRRSPTPRTTHALSTPSRTGYSTSVTSTTATSAKTPSSS